MKLVVYMLKKFFGIFLGSLLFFILVLMLTDLLMNLWSYISKSVPSKTVGHIMLLYLPKTVWYALPIAMLFATAYMLSDFYARNELLAVFASGVSLFKFAAPLLIVAVFMSFGMFFLENNLVVKTFAKKEALQKKVLKTEKNMNNDNIVIMAEGGRIVYQAEYYDDSLKRLFTVYIMFRDENKNLQAIIVADNASYQTDHWVLSGATQYSYEDGNVKIKGLDQELIKRLTESPETFRNNTISVETVNTEEARAYIRHLEKAGLPSSEAKSVYYKKFSFPFVLVIVVFLAVGLSGKTRKNVLIISLFLSILSVVLFYVTQMITMLMAKFGTIPPLFGAWFPVFLFIVISIVLLKYART